MKTPFVMSLLAALTFVACGTKTEQPPKDEPAGEPAAKTNSQATGNPLTAPVDYLGAVGKAKKSMEGTLDRVAVDQAIQQFAGIEGRYPKDLNELVTQKYLPRLPAPPYGMKYNYDSASGKVTVVKQ
jgi:hypothetical protein